LVRSTIYSAPLPPVQRLNRFPATPFCAITWMIEGDAMLVAPATSEKAGPGEAIFSGPRAQPCMTANPGPVHTITVLFFAEALRSVKNGGLRRHPCRLLRTMRPASPCWKNGWSRAGAWSAAPEGAVWALSRTGCRRSPCALEQQAWGAAHEW
jgi:hypothetical protein